MTRAGGSGLVGFFVGNGTTTCNAAPGAFQDFETRSLLIGEWRHATETVAIFQNDVELDTTVCSAGWKPNNINAPIVLGNRVSGTGNSLPHNGSTTQAFVLNRLLTPTEKTCLSNQDRGRRLADALTACSIP